MKVRKIVFPVDGLGTRFLPATKVTPKEMLPVAEKPLIQYAFEEALEAGIERFIFITGRNKDSIENHFDNAFELQTVLREKNKEEMIEKAIGWLPKAGHIVFIRQQNPLGLGHAILCAEKFIGSEPFAISLADEMVYEDNNYLSRMLNLYEKEQCNIIGIDELERIEDVVKYGIVKVNNSQDSEFYKISDMLEKPSVENAPSKLAIVGRYVLQPEIFEILRNAKAGVNNEIQLTDAMKVLMNSQKFLGLKFKGKRFDCGSIVGYLDANINYALKNDKIRKDVIEILKKYNSFDNIL